MDPSAPGWYPDPSGRHERRYWSGIRWSRHVYDGGQRSDDPVEPESRATAVVRAATGWTPRVPVTSRPEPPPQQPRDPFAAGPRPASRRRYQVFAGVLVVLLVAAGGFVMLTQGGSDEQPAAPSGSDPLIAAVRTSLEHRGHGTITSTESRCMADAVVNVSGRAHLIEQGVDRGADALVALDPGNKDQAVKKAFDCLDDPTMLAFMAADWSETDTGKAIGHSPCVFQGLFKGMGRDRMVFLYSGFASYDPPPLPEAMNENELPLVSRVLSDCMSTKGTSTTAAP